jgi:hypothetical protein
MGKDYVQQGQSGVSKRFRQSRQPSTLSSSVSVTDQEHKNRNSFIDQTPNNNKRSK